MFNLILTIALFFVVIILMSKRLKIAPEDQRFAVFTLGRFAGFSGPGLVLAAPFVTKLWASILRDRVPLYVDL
jgi:regulator of protease activity HflC (stomatin/prohibitin superfamily)